MTNNEKLQSYLVEQKRPLIFYNVETTGCMNGNDNRITQIALTAYEYNNTSGKYELQDHMFLLAKANENSLQNIENRSLTTDENITALLKEEYVFNYTDNVKKDIKNCQNRQKTLQNKIDKAVVKYGENSAQVEDFQNRLLEEIAMEENLAQELNEKTAYAAEHEKDLIESQECLDYVDKYFALKKEQLENQTPLKDVLFSQGINLDTWRKSGLGLSFGEIQIGINKFLQSYAKEDSVFMSNGTYFAKHYMDKERLSLNKDKEEIDVPKVLGQTDWTYSLSKISADYFRKTGKTIQNFDALTKALCMAEMIGSRIGVSFKNTSQKYLEEQAKWEVAKGRDGDYIDGDYVLTMSQLEKANIVMDIPRYDKNIPIFNSLEYVDFGSERRYVDIDKMFEVNNNFEITLEGEKDPIKTWEELEAKIKALNGEISPELLNRIHEKYDEIKEQVTMSFSFNDRFDEQVETEEEAEEEIEEDIEEKEPSVTSRNPIEEHLLRIFEKNSELNTVREKEHSLFQNKWNVILQDMKALDNVLQSIGLSNVKIDNSSNFYYQVNRQCITNGCSKESDDIALIMSSKLENVYIERCAKYFVNNWDSVYEKILIDIESKLDDKINVSKKNIDYYEEMEMD